MDTTEAIEVKKSILEALEAKYGIVTDACNSIGLQRSTFYKWLKTDLEFKEAVEELQEVAIDYVEGKLFERITGVEILKGVDKDGHDVVYSLPPDVQAISLYLKTRGKKRGYIERTELTGADGRAVVNELHIKIIRDKATGIAPGDFTPQPATNTGSEETV